MMFSRRQLLLIAPGVAWAAAARAQDAAISRAHVLRVSIRDFGAAGDGRSDDTDAFKAMHAYLSGRQIETPGLRIQVTLPPGHYRYRWNRFLWGLRDVEVDAYGARLECTNDHARHFECYPLVTNRNAFQTIRPDDQLSSPHEGASGEFIENASPGDSRVILTLPSAAAAFAPGRHVLIMSYDQQFSGYPPNARYFEFRRIAAIDGGIIRLDRPLDHEHRADAPEGDGVGRARILAVDREDAPLATRQVIAGATFLPNAHLDEADAQYVLAQGVLSFEMRDCVAPSFVASCGGSFLLERCAIDFCEPDKIVSELALRDCRIGRFTQATGVSRFQATGTTFAAPVNVQSRDALFNSCQFHGAASEGEYRSGLDLRGFAPTHRLAVRRCVFYGKNQDGDAAIGPLGFRANDLTCIPLEDPVRIEDDAIVAPLPSPQAVQLLRTLEPGGLVLAAENRGGEIRCDGRFGRIRAIRGDGAVVRIEADWSGRAREGDVLVAPRVRRLDAEENTFLGVAARWPIVLDQTFQDMVARSETFELRRSCDFAAEIVPLPGALVSLTIEVLRPYAGEGGGFLHVDQNEPEGEDLAVSVDLRTIGSHVFEPRRAEPFLWSVRVSHAVARGGASAALEAAGERKASYVLRFRMRNPFAAV